MKSIPRYTVGWKFFSSFRRVFSPTVVTENLAVSRIKSSGLLLPFLESSLLVSLSALTE